MSYTKAELAANYRQEGEGVPSIDADAVSLRHAVDMEAEEREALAEELRRIGTSESFNNKNEMGLSVFLREHAAEVGASVVIFDITPGKFRSARQGADGRLDVTALRADPPASWRPGGYYLLRVRYYASA